ncbi:MAG: hypothetical protein H7255_13990 [Ramlibacter sp.]|nr:hypothetical protein [Ramlibacter sp.]
MRKVIGIKRRRSLHKGITHGKQKATFTTDPWTCHRRAEGDYMSVLLDAVTLDDWRAVINNAKKRAKDGDPQARAWLAQYLMGNPVCIGEASWLRVRCLILSTQGA